jgi:hypothetical protein
VHPNPAGLDYPEPADNGFRFRCASKFRTSSVKRFSDTVRGNRSTSMPAPVRGGKRRMSAKSRSSVIKQRPSEAHTSNNLVSSTPIQLLLEHRLDIMPEFRD